MPLRYRFKEARLAGVVIICHPDLHKDPDLYNGWAAHWLSVTGEDNVKYFPHKDERDRWLTDFCEPLAVGPTDQAVPDSELAPCRDELRLEAGDELARRHDQALRVLRDCPGSSPLVKLAIQTLDPTGDQRALLARLEERVIDGTATEAETAQYRDLSANTPTMMRAVDLAMRGLLPKRQRSDEQDLTKANLPLEFDLWVWSKHARKWRFFEYMGGRWFGPSGVGMTSNEIRLVIHDGAHVRVAHPPPDPAPSDSVPDPIEDSPSGPSYTGGWRLGPKRSGIARGQTVLGAAAKQELQSVLDSWNDIPSP